MGISFNDHCYWSYYCVVMEMSIISEVFTELFFGQGAWLGLILFMTMTLGLVSKIKYSSIIMIPFTIFLGIFYLDNIASNSIFMWCAVLMFLTTVLIIVIELNRKGGK